VLQKPCRLLIVEEDSYLQQVPTYVLFSFFTQ
jgi:hypothetical protein